MAQNGMFAPCDGFLSNEVVDKCPVSAMLFWRRARLWSSSVVAPSKSNGACPADGSKTTPSPCRNKQTERQTHGYITGFWLGRFDEQPGYLPRGRSQFLFNKRGSSGGYTKGRLAFPACIFSSLSGIVDKFVLIQLAIWVRVMDDLGIDRFDEFGRLAR